MLNIIEYQFEYETWPPLKKSDMAKWVFIPVIDGRLDVSRMAMIYYYARK